MTATRRLAVLASTLIAALALALSFVALSTLVQWAGKSAVESYGWAIVADGLIVVATLSVYAERGEDHRYPWAVFIAASLVSVAGNVTHAVLAPGQLPVWLSATIAAIPPLAHLVATHLTVRLLRDAETPERERHVTELVDMEPIAVDQPAPVAETFVIPAEAEPAPAPEPVTEPTPTPEPARTPPLDGRARALAALDDGMTQKEAADLVGVSERTVRRWAAAVSA